MEYLNRKNGLKALVQRFGAVEVARQILDDLCSDAQRMGVGIDEQNPIKVASVYESLYDNIQSLRTLLGENRPTLSGEINQQIK